MATRGGAAQAGPTDSWGGQHGSLELSRPDVLGLLTAGPPETPPRHQQCPSPSQLSSLPRRADQVDGDGKEVLLSPVGRWGLVMPTLSTSPAGAADDDLPSPS